MKKQQAEDSRDKVGQELHETPESPQGSPGPKEIGGPKGPEPTRYGDWEKAGRCVDF